MADIAPSVTKARYAKGKIAVHCPADGSGLKTRAARLAARIGGDCYSNRERAYIMPITKAERVLKLYRDGYDACVMTGEIFDPAQESAQ